MKHLVLSALLLTTPITITACGTIPAATASKLDEQALGAVYAAATLANHAITASAPTMNRDQALKTKALKVKMDGAVKAAERAKAVGDTFAYSTAISDATSALNAISAIVKEK